MIIIFSFYYPPVMAPSAFRILDLTKALLEQKQNKYKNIKIFTAEIDRNLVKKNIVNNLNDKRLEVVRIKVPFKDSNKKNEFANFVVYFFKSIFFTFKLKPSMILGTSGRLGTNFLAALVGFFKNKPYILDIRDLFAINTQEIILKNYPILGQIFFKVIINLEKLIYKNAYIINVVSEGFIKYYKSIGFEVNKWTFFPNGYDEIFKNEKKKISLKPNIENKKILLYAGNLGLGQGIEKLVLKISKYLPRDWFFIIIGSGKKFVQIQNIINKNNILNVILLPPVDKLELLSWYHRVNAFLINLNNFDCLNYVIPSKSFELGLFKKPIIAGVKGYTAAFLKNEIPNVHIFKPCDGKNAVKILKLSFKKQNQTIIKEKRNLLLKKYYRKNSLDQFVEKIFSEWKF